MFGGVGESQREAAALAVAARWSRPPQPVLGTGVPTGGRFSSWVSPAKSGLEQRVAKVCRGLVQPPCTGNVPWKQSLVEAQREWCRVSLIRWEMNEHFSSCHVEVQVRAKPCPGNKLQSLQSC